MKSLIPIHRIERRIFMIRGQKVMLDSDLAELYGVTTKRLNEQVKRNRTRFPLDFMFRLNAKEINELNRSQFATGSQKHRDLRFAPNVFTEHGAVMLASVLNSPRAVKMSLHVVRTFVMLREMLATHKDLARKLEDLEKKYDSQFRAVFDAIREFMKPPDKPKPWIGFAPR